MTGHPCICPVYLSANPYLLIPQFARTDPGAAGYGLSAESAAIGLLLLPLALGQTVCGPLAGAVSRRIPARVVFAAGLLLVTAGLAVLAVTRTSTVATAGAALLLGMGAGTALQAGSAVATEDVPADVAAVSTALNSTVRRLAGGVGGQVDTILLASLVAAAVPSLRAYMISYTVAGVFCLAGVGVVLTGTSCSGQPGPARSSRRQTHDSPTS